MVWALDESDDEAVSRLVKRGYPVEGLSGAESTPLMTAVDANDLEMVKVLVRLGAHGDHQNTAGVTPFVVAVTNERLPILETLVHSGVNLNGDVGRRALIAAVVCRKVAALKFLLAHGAPCDARYEREGDRTVLIMAAKRNESELAEALVRAGADVNLRSALGETALSCAKNWRNRRLVRLLRAHKAVTE